MTARQKQRFTNSLRAKERELDLTIQRLRGGLEVIERGDSLDRVRHISERESIVRDLEFELRLLRGVREALREIGAGTFGRCAACDREIPLARLKAIPWSPYCIRCQEKTEVIPARVERNTRYYAKAG